MRSDNNISAEDLCDKFEGFQSVRERRGYCSMDISKDWGPRSWLKKFSTFKRSGSRNLHWFRRYINAWKGLPKSGTRQDSGLKLFKVAGLKASPTEGPRISAEQRLTWNKRLTDLWHETKLQEWKHIAKELERLLCICSPEMTVWNNVTFLLIYNLWTEFKTIIFIINTKLITNIFYLFDVKVKSLYLLSIS